ncbi:Fe3+/spermidine/putrescine ABC transporter ATP-binding protein [Ventosimonas gracilis]|uniref:Spermidine/putrescine import ATP-binding protein PotA n=1 Tax=Ventosimonas gracilis TaxID=1680762 RepID=A0A139SUA3_9GAMM|nr:ABC transporter ATP-binding protein [Ventosimonas gracilis]KXU38021.1 Fe3+/spermidine/putrescine ABC transporter ATP-binding protein [Ventosimonas gracilis]
MTAQDNNTNEAFLRFVQVKKTYDQQSLVVKDFNLDVAKGEFITLLGPSGSGKTTCLMMLAGFEDVTSGKILINGRNVTDIAPYDRNIGMVFQQYALFPHMTIRENLAYPLKLRKQSSEQVQAKVDEYLKLIELESFGGRYPGQLSGGQRQRVALARALIFEPDIVLMDEPLGALDKKLREQMQFEIKRLHEQLGFTVIYVTHDQTEALTMSDRIAVFSRGVVQQCDAPHVLYENPTNLFVADFIGESNKLDGVVESIDEQQAKVRLTSGATVSARRAAGGVNQVGQKTTVSVRPEKLTFTDNLGENGNRIPARFVTRHYVGEYIRYHFASSCGTELVVKSLNDSAAPRFKSGQEVSLAWLPEFSQALDHPAG